MSRDRCGLVDVLVTGNPDDNGGMGSGNRYGYGIAAGSSQIRFLQLADPGPDRVGIL